MGQVGYHHPTLYRTAARLLQPHVAHLPLPALANLLHCYSRAAHYDAALFKEVAAEVGLRLPAGECGAHAGAPPASLWVSVVPMLGLRLPACR